MTRPGVVADFGMLHWKRAVVVLPSGITGGPCVEPGG